MSVVTVFNILFLMFHQPCFYEFSKILIMYIIMNEHRICKMSPQWVPEVNVI